MLLYKKGRIPYFFAFTLFILSALYGLLIRWNFVFPIESFVYKNFLQSHSHVAFLGWGYISIITLITQCYLTEYQIQNKVYKTSLAIVMTTVVLMLISFPIGGYKVFSIVLLAVFGITSYVLSYRLLKDLKGIGIDVKLIKYGIYYYLLSSLATWFLAVVLVTQGKTDLYYNTVYFYLHFLYNGFFVFTLFGLLFKIFKINNISINNNFQYNFFIYLNIACIPAYALSVLWSRVLSIFYVVGFAASFLQLISLIFLFKIIKSVFSQLKWNTISKLLLMFGLIAYSLKIVMQVFSSFPYFVEKSLALKPFLIIGYLHLFTLGFMSVMLLLILIEFGKIQLKSSFSKIGVYIFLTGILITELLFFLQGSMIIMGLGMFQNYNIYLLIFSSFIVIGLIFIYFNQFKNRVA